MPEHRFPPPVRSAPETSHGTAECGNFVDLSFPRATLMRFLLRRPFLDVQK